MTSTRSSDPGHGGSTTRPSITVYVPASLARLGRLLTSVGYTTDIEQEPIPTRSLRQDVLGTITVWRLTWFRKTTSGSDHSGVITVVAMEDELIPFTLDSVDHPADEAPP